MMAPIIIWMSLLVSFSEAGDKIFVNSTSTRTVNNESASIACEEAGNKSDKNSSSKRRESNGVGLIGFDKAGNKSDKNSASKAITSKFVGNVSFEKAGNKTNKNSTPKERANNDVGPIAIVEIGNKTAWNSTLKRKANHGVDLNAFAESVNKTYENFTLSIRSAFGERVEKNSFVIAIKSIAEKVGKEIFCLGVRLSHSTVITVNHLCCKKIFEEMQPTFWYGGMSHIVPVETVTGEMVIPAESTYIHNVFEKPHYKRDDKYRDDLCLINNNIPEGRRYFKVPFPSVPKDVHHKPTTDRVTFQGVINETNIQKIYLHLLPDAKCEQLTTELHIPFDKEIHLCTLNNNVNYQQQSVTETDVGGPLMTDDGYVYGLYSHGVEKGPVAVFYKVAAWHDTIMRTIYHRDNRYNLK